MKRISLRLFLAIITFFIGISLTTFWIFLYNPKPNLVSPNIISESANEQAKTFEVNKSMLEANSIKIEYAWSLMGVESLEGQFYVTNNTGETIKYLANNFGQSNPFWIKQNGKTKQVNLPYLVGIDAANERELKPNESTVFSIPVPQNDKPFEAGFNFLVGVESKEKIVWVKVEKQLKSYGLACSEEIIKAGNVLAKTCISTLID